MGQAGRPRKSKAEKIASGTLQKCREVGNALEFRPISSVDVPDYLEGYAVEFFEYYSRLMASVGLLTPADMLELEKASIAYSMMREAYDDLKENGSMQVTRSGYTQKTAAFTVYSDANKILSDFSNRYGLNVVSRERITMSEPDNEDDLDKLQK